MGFWFRSCRCCSASSGANYSDALSVPVPAHVLWETVSDLAAIPEILTMVTSMERISGGNHRGNTSQAAPGKTPSSALRVGTRFRETRTHRGQDYTLYKTVTRLTATPSPDDPAQERSLSLGISITNPNGTANDVVNTSTLIVQRVDESSSRLILTVAITWGSVWDQLSHLLCGCFIRTMVMQGLTQEIEDYRTAAVARYDSASQVDR